VNEVRAIVVAVERYDVGGAWDLDGPAADASRFVRWLRSRGVPDASITLLASPLPANQAMVGAIGLPARPAAQSVVYDVLAKELPDDRAGLLMMHWGGHGVVDGDGRRRLFYSDATERDKRNLDFNALSRALLTPYFPFQDQQLLVVDACQNLTSELQFVHLLPHQTIPEVPSLMPDRQQHTLFSASPGEVALNDSTRKTGLFSAELLTLLNDPTAPWPPRAEWLAARLNDRFARLRAEGTANQHPPYLWHRTPTVEGVVFGLTPANRPPGRLSLQAIGAIVEVMVDVDELASVSNLQSLINMLPPLIRGAVPYQGIPRADILQLLLTCQRYQNGREALALVLDVGMGNRHDLARVIDVLNRHWPVPQQ
jgi:hypothetical protein